MLRVADGKENIGGAPLQNHGAGVNFLSWPQPESESRLQYK